MIVKTSSGKALIEKATKDKYIELAPLGKNHIFKMRGWELKKHSNSYHMAIRKKHGDCIPDYGYETDSYLKSLPSHGSHFMEPMKENNDEH